MELTFFNVLSLIQVCAEMDSRTEILTDDVEMQTITNAHSELLYPELQKFKNHAVEMITGI